MNTTKLKEALVELQQQRSIIDGAISNIQRAIAMMQSGNSSEPESEPRVRSSTYIDDGVTILETVAAPMHIREIAKKIGEMRGTEIARASVESSFIRHIALLKDRARIVKLRPAMFGLPSWKSIIHESKPTVTA